MYLNLLYIYFILICLSVVRVNCVCDSYLECLSDFVEDLFNKNDTVNQTTVEAKDLAQVKNIDLDIVNKVLSDVSYLLKSELDDQNLKDRRAIYKRIHDHTKIFVKSFDVKKADDDVERSTELTETDLETSTVDSLLVKTINDDMKSEEKTKLNNKENVHDNEIPNTDDDFGSMYYDILDDNSTDYPIIDYVDFYKDTTNEDIYITTDTPPSTEVNNVNEEMYQRMNDIDEIITHSLDLVKSGFNITGVGGSCNGNASSSDLADVVYPWLVSIFVKNDTSGNQFQYFCDGAILSENAILTAARCVNFETTVDPENLLVVLGKRSLQSMADTERTHKIKAVFSHDNFTLMDGVAVNDLAILVVDDNVMFSQYIQPSCMTDQYETILQAATTAWDYTGTLHPVYFEKNSVSCVNNNQDESTFCATYGNHVPLCPNYGGIYVTRQEDNQWYLQGIRTGDPTVRGLCFEKTVIYTSLKNHAEWISETVENIKQIY